MKIILLDNIKGLGLKNDVVETKDGYALNFLFPSRLAKSASDKSIAEIESGKLKQKEKEKTELIALKKALSELVNPIEIKAPANEKGNLFAGINTHTIAQKIREAVGMNVPESFVSAKNTIKEVGEYNISIRVGEERFIIKVEVKGDT
jgi:large subunit ribosomal protein L9